MNQTPTVTVVNMIPRSLSRESEPDSEPMIAVDPADPDRIVGSAFTPDPMGGNLAPVYLSTDGGLTWTLNAIVPGGDMTGDITVAFSGTAARLYAGILRSDSPIPGQTRMAHLRTDDPFVAVPMTILEDRQQPDQPFAQAATVADGSDAGQERLFVGNNDFAAGQRTATLDVFLNVGAQDAAIKRVRLEKRTTAGQDGPQVRPTIHPDGTVYAAYYGWRSFSGNFAANTLRVTSDVVVVRDDDWGKGGSAFEDLRDAGDNTSGVRVVTNVSFAFDRSGKAVNGQQRLGGDLSIAVDPRPGMSSTVYLAWGDEPTPGVFTLHVRRSTDRGSSWSATDLLTLPRATNGALAVNRDGVVGLLYQQLAGAGADRRWSTHFSSSLDGSTWSDLVLADTPANTPLVTLNPYLGDYVHLVAVDADFCGIFSANNTPDQANFPNGVTYQRNHDFATQRLLALDGVTPVPVSIDPFFFRVTL